MEALNTRQMNLRFELAATIISFRERLLSFAQYNLEELDDDTKATLMGMINLSGLNQTPEELLDFTKNDTYRETSDG